MRRQIARLFYPYGTERKVLRGPARGMRFTVERGIGLTYAIGSKDAAPRCFSQWVRPGMTVYDVGANKGQMMLLFAALVGRSGRVVSFEPSPAEFESLVRNAKLNRLDDRVSLHRAAAADQDGELCFTYAPTRPTQGKLKNVEPTYINSGAEEFDVSAVTLDSIAVVERPPDVIKIDVEGAAALVLRGATRVLKDHSPAIYLELHGPEEQAGVRDELQSRGYIVETIDGERIDDPTAGWFSPLWCYHEKHNSRTDSFAASTFP